jgi:hypothetical protein
MNDLFLGAYPLFLFMAILAEAFFPLVGSHFMPFSFLSAGHGIRNLTG